MKIYYNCYHQMPYFNAEMHQIRFRLGLRPRPCWESLHRSPIFFSWVLGDLLLREGREGEVGGGRGPTPNRRREREKGVRENREGEQRGVGGKGREKRGDGKRSTISEKRPPPSSDG